ncbi:MAG TPA: SDR family NAD(P)-dependent oxidoreductase [Gammaproteobacteria bacterium]|nr:SDR family NAD(P)-dependent oxidoreductase [Gammaproteobacteria bacterium]
MINIFLVTGATKGLGRSIVSHLAHLNYRVYAVGRTKELLEDLSAKNPLIHPISCDITKPNDLDKIIAAVSQEKSLSIIHNAAVIVPRLFVNDDNNAALMKQFDTDFFAPLLLTKKLLPLLHGGQRVLHISSQAANLALPGLMGYCISKAALEQATRCLNAELAEKKIYFSIFRPGLLDTPMQTELRTSNPVDLPGRDFYIDCFEEKKLNDPDDIARHVVQVMLHSTDKAYVDTVWDVNVSPNIP